MPAYTRASCDSATASDSELKLRVISLAGSGSIGVGSGAAKGDVVGAEELAQHLGGGASFSGQGAGVGGVGRGHQERAPERFLTLAGEAMLAQVA
jgi:hypothetical protein